MTILQTRKAEVLKKAEELYTTVMARRDLEKKEAALKNYFKEVIGDGGGIRAGSYLVTLTPKSRSVLDRDILIEHFGLDGVKAFERLLPYTEVNVTEATY